MGGSENKSKCRRSVYLKGYLVISKARSVVPQRHGPLHAHAFGGFNAGFVNFGVHGLATQGVHVLVKHLLQVDEAALAGAVVPMLQCR